MENQPWESRIPAWAAESPLAQAVARRLLQSAAEIGQRGMRQPTASGNGQDTPPGELNPLEPAAAPDGSRFPLQGHARLVRTLFLATFGTDEPFPQVLTGALLRCYERAGWSLVTGGPASPAQEPPAYPALGHLHSAALAVVDDAGFDRATAAKARDLVNHRISPRLCAADGLAPDDDQSRAFLSGTALIRQLENPVKSDFSAERPALTALS